MTLSPGLELIDRRNLRPALRYPWAIGHIGRKLDIGRWHTKREALGVAAALGDITDWGVVPEEDVLSLARAEVARHGGAPGRLRGVIAEPEVPAPRPEPVRAKPGPRQAAVSIPAPRRGNVVGGPDQPNDAYGLWVQDAAASCPDCSKRLGVTFEGRPVHLIMLGDKTVIESCPVRLKKAIEGSG